MNRGMGLHTAPILDDGLFILTTPQLLVVRLDDRLTPKAFEVLKAAWLDSVDARLPNARVGAFYDIPEWSGFSTNHAREWAALLRSRDEVLRRTTVGMALVTPSPLVRGTLRTIYWLAPPPFEYELFEELDDGWDYMATKLGTIDPKRTCEEYRELVRVHVPPRPRPKSGSPPANDT